MPLQAAPIKTISRYADQIAVDNTYLMWFGGRVRSRVTGQMRVVARCWTSYGNWVYKRVDGFAIILKQ